MVHNIHVIFMSCLDRFCQMTEKVIIKIVDTVDLQYIKNIVQINVCIKFINAILNAQGNVIKFANGTKQ